MEKESPRDISNSILMFNLISKFFGFAVVQPNVTFIHRSIRESSLFLYLLLSTSCTIRSELWCLIILEVAFTEKKIIIFIITQMTIVSPLFCLFLHRLNNSKIWNIIEKIKLLEENLILYNVEVKVMKMKFYALTYPFIQIFLIFSIMIYMLLQFPIFLMFDSTCMFYFEVWVAVPCLQFVGWISLLSYILCCIQCKIIQLHKRDWSIQPWNRLGLKRTKSMRLDKLSYDTLIKIKRFVVILKQVMNIATESASAYESMVLIYLCYYLARLMAIFYDFIETESNSQKFSIRLGIWSVVVRVIFILPVFVCCENFTSNVNRTVQVIQKLTVLHHPSRLNIVFQSLTLRLRHKAPTIEICGILKITYKSFLTILTTSVAFLVLQLQSS